MTDVEIIILGCGNSAGVPAITNWWGNCDPENPKNRRTRPSIALKSENTTVIIDTGPDFKEQYNRENLSPPGGIIYTHMHADHTAGIDELRNIKRLTKQTFKIYGAADTLESLKMRYEHMFKESESGFYKLVCEPHEVKNNDVLSIGDIQFKVFEQDHGTITSLGLRIGDLGYSTDMKHLDDNAYDVLKGIKVWIVDAAGYQHPANPVHASIEEVVAMNERIGAEEVYLTHLPPTMDYASIEKELPDGFFMAYDGLRFKTTL